MTQRTHKPKAEKHSAKTFTLGRIAFAKVSAVEGIRMPATMEQEFSEYDRKGLSPEERRRLIRKKYAGVR